MHMKLQELPPWTQGIPVVLGVGFSLIGMQIFPGMGLRPVLGPIIGLPMGVVLGFGSLAIYAASRKD